MAMLAGMNRTDPACRSLAIALVSETFPPDINGVAMTLGRLTDGLLARGHTLEVVRPHRKNRAPPPATTAFRETRAPGVTIPAYPELCFGLPWQRRLLENWRAAPPDLVHVATEGPLGWSALNAARRLDIPVTSSFHTHFEHYSRHYGYAWLARPVAAYLRHFHNRSALTFVPTAAMAATLAAAGYRRLAVLARGVDPQLFSPKRRSPELRQSWGVGQSGLAVLVVGRLAPEKNLGLALKAFAAMQRLRPDARLILVGDGPTRAALAASPLPIHFAGMRTGEELARHYASGDVFLFPSLTETFGNVCLEAMASGLPVVAYARAAAGALIEDGVCGLLAPPDDADAFVAAGVRLAAYPELARRLGQTARVRVARHDWESIHARFAETLHAVVRQHALRTTADTAAWRIVPD
jgi:glycosyltransferase involved in cell wall biosynthesis